MAYSIDTSGGPSVLSGYSDYISPATVTPSTTAPAATNTAITLGNQAYSQLPGYSEALANVGANIKSETAGQLPPDVLRQLQQAAAERGVSTGSPGSPNSNASYLQALGLNSLQLTNTGQANLQNILPVLPGSGISQNPNFYVNPALQYEAGATNAANQAAAYNANAARRNSLKATTAGISAGGSSAGFSMPQVGFNTTPAATDYGPYGPSAPVTATSTGGGTSIGGQIYYGDAASIAQQIQNKYKSTVTGNMNNGAPGEEFTPTTYDEFSDEQNYDSGGDYYDDSYYGDY